MNVKRLGLIGWIADTVVFVLVIVGLCINMLKPTEDIYRGENFKVNHYGKAGLRHTCKVGDNSFNEGCLVYQGSVVLIITCATALLTIGMSALLSLLMFCAADKIESAAGDDNNPVSSPTGYILTTSLTHLLLFCQLLVGLITYTIGSHRVRTDFKYEFGPGWILILVSTIITFCISAMFFVAQCFISKLLSFVSLLIQILTSFTPFGSFFVLVGICTSFYNSTYIRINALKYKQALYTPGPLSVHTPGTVTMLHKFCNTDGDVNGHLCNLYKSSATIITFTVIGLLASGLVNEKTEKKKRVAGSIVSFVFLTVGFIQYAAVGKKVKDDLNLHYGLGWIFYLCGVCFNAVGMIVNLLSVLLCNDRLAKMKQDQNQGKAHEDKQQEQDEGGGGEENQQA